MKHAATALFILSLALAASCASAPPAIPQDASAKQLIQRAQEANDADDLNGAIAYYSAALERFPADPDATIACQYEIAFIYYKQGKYAEALALFEKLLARYEGPEAEYLSPQFKILALQLLPKTKEALGLK